MLKVVHVFSGLLNYTFVFSGLILKDKVGHLHASPIYTQHLPYSQSSSYFNTRDHSSLHDLVPPHVLPPTSTYSLSSSTQPLASSYAGSASRDGLITFSQILAFPNKHLLNL